jgi:hypothetical protein
MNAWWFHPTEFDCVVDQVLKQLNQLGGVTQDSWKACALNIIRNVKNHLLFFFMGLVSDLLLFTLLHIYPQVFASYLINIFEVEALGLVIIGGFTTITTSATLYLANTCDISHSYPYDCFSHLPIPLLTVFIFSALKLLIDPL